MSRGEPLCHWLKEAADDNSSLKRSRAIKTNIVPKATKRLRDTLSGGDTIKWPHPEANSILKRLNKIGSMKETNPEFFSFVKDPLLRIHLIRFSLFGKWYDRFFEGRQREVSLSSLYRNLQEGSSYADYLSDLIKYSYRSYEGFDYDVKNKPVDETVSGFDDIFSPFHLLPFERPCPKDFDLAFVLPTNAHIDRLTDFFHAVGSNFKNREEKPPFLDDLDRLTTLTGSVVMTKPWVSGINVFERCKRRCPLTLNTSKFEFMECDVTKGPHESRACWVPDIKTMNSIKLVHKQFKRVSNCPYDYYYRRPSYKYLTKWLQSEEDGRFFIMSDLKKSGLTFPWLLLRTLQKQLCAMYPDWNFSLLEGWRSATIYRLDKSIQQTTAGVGLGMADPIISFSMGVIFSLWKERWAEIYDIDALFWGDDQCIRLIPLACTDPSEIDHEDVLEDWNSFQREFGLTVHPDKSFISRRGVLLETYGNPVGNEWKQEKLGQWIGCFFNAITAHNICEAKTIVKAVDDCIWDDWKHMCDPAIASIIDFWGYEFLESECCLPFELGGWTSVYEEGLNTWMLSIKDLLAENRSLSFLLDVKAPRAVKQGLKVDEIFQKEVESLGGKTWEKMAKSAMNPVIMRPSARRYQERWEKVKKRRKELFSLRTPLTVRQILNTLGPRNAKIPAELLTKQRGTTSFGLYLSPSNDFDPLRSLLALEGNKELMISYPDSATVKDLQENVLSFTLKAETEIIDQNLFLWCLVNHFDYELHQRDLAFRGLQFDESFLNYSEIPNIFVTTEEMRGKKKSLLFLDNATEEIIFSTQTDKDEYQFDSLVFSRLYGFPISTRTAKDMMEHARCPNKSDIVLDDDEIPVITNHEEISNDEKDIAYILSMTKAVYDRLDLLGDAEDRKKQLPDAWVAGDDLLDCFGSEDDEGFFGVFDEDGVG